MVRAEMPGRNKSDIVTGDFGAGFKPFEDIVRDGVGDVVSLAFGRAGTEGGGNDALMKLGAVKGFAWTLTFAFDDDCRFTCHYRFPIESLRILQT